MNEFLATINTLSWPGAFALVGIAAALAYWLKGHPTQELDEDDIRRIVREELKARGGAS